jgi:O-antigen/teichoic acid export membrane protein
MADIKKSFISSLKWSSFSKIVISILQISQLLIMTRILAPADFGIMALIMVVTGFFSILADGGISKVLIIHDDLTKRQLATLYWLNVIIGLTLTIFLYFFAVLIAAFYQSDQLVGLLKLVSISFLIIALSNQYKMLMEKEFRFEVLAKIEVLSNSLSFILTLYFAYAGYGVYALVYGYLITTVCSSLLTLIINYHRLHFSFIFDLLSVQKYLSFGLYQLGERTINYFSSQSDIIIVGKLLGVELLGIYSLAKNLVGRPLQILLPMVTRVLFPYFAKLKHTPYILEKEFLQAINLISTVTFLFFSYLALFSEQIFALLFIDEWQSSAPIFSILCIHAMFLSHASPVNLLFLTKGRADIGFKWNLLMLFFIPAYLYGMSHFTLEVVALSWIMLRILQLYPGWWFLVRPVSAISFQKYTYSLFRPLLSVSFAMLFTWYCVNYIDNNLFGLYFGTVILFFTYSIATYYFNKKAFCTVKLFITQTFKGKE